jgi:hypothetical protein
LPRRRDSCRSRGPGGRPRDPRSRF